ncbi:uncharacterized protein BXIN_2175 [Babesia sp. Xinjiang]|uniref:uncharacterized protein n=1 Tax=Babesia sp. Xinjiang TaxID=462227 RepID=UPI000A240737|nr:uncharacterized protein BXIN_2175 [Babesia sp. Xinjiang]ORM40420.1 hypothetical protein BXIN_2175 [Babesia sp. Xinjiang]
MMCNRLELFCKRYAQMAHYRSPSLTSVRFFSAEPSDVWSFGYSNRTITLKLSGLPSLPKKRKNSTLYTSNRRVIEAAVSAVPSCDIVAMGLGAPELGVIHRYLEFKKSKSSQPKQAHKFKNARQLVNTYQQYVDVAEAAAATGINVIGIGRSKQSEAASFGKAATENKLEVLRLLSLYLRIGDVLKDVNTQEEFKKAAPSIYQAVVAEGAFYCFCRLHELFYRIDEELLCRRKNVKLLVVVDQHLVHELTELIRKKMPAMLDGNTPPMVDVLQSLDNRSRKGWTRFLLQFIIIPGFAITATVCYELYVLLSPQVNALSTHFTGRGYLNTFRNNGKSSHKTADPVDISRE